MKLATRLILVLVAVIAVTLATHGVLESRREIEQYETDLRRDHHMIGTVLGREIRAAWERAGDPEAEQTVRRANDAHALLELRWHGSGAESGDSLAAARSGRETVRGASGPVLHTFVPVIASTGQVVGVLELAESRAPETEYVRETALRSVLTTTTLATVCALLVVLLVVGFVGRPVGRLVEHVRRVGAGEFGARIEVGRGDELDALAHEMNAMAQRLEQSRRALDEESKARVTAVLQLEHAERLATLGTIGAGIAHELGTPLNVVSARAKMIARDPGASDPARAHARIIGEQSDRITGIVRQLLGFARRRTPERVDVDVASVVGRAYSLLSSLASKHDVRLEPCTHHGRVTAVADAGQLEQVFANLIVNAIHAQPTGGVVRTRIDEVRVKPPPELGGDSERAFLRVTFADEGPGIAPEVLARVFEPFFTTKRVGEGTGLGLSIARGIARDNGGFMEAESVEGVGTQFHVFLPTAALT